MKLHCCYVQFNAIVARTYVYRRLYFITFGTIKTQVVSLRYQTACSIRVCRAPRMSIARKRDFFAFELRFSTLNRFLRTFLNERGKKRKDIVYANLNVLLDVSKNRCFFFFRVNLDNDIRQVRMN